MARLADSVDNERRYLEELDCPVYHHAAFNPPVAMAQQRVTLISSAGLMQRGDTNIRGDMAQYRAFADVTDADILLNHISVNFDRTGFAEDINTVFPRALLNKMENDTSIAHAANEHYSFMGATAPDKMQPHAHELATRLKAKHINTACLLPV